MKRISAQVRKIAAAYGDPATEFARQVARREIVAGKHQILAAERHLRDLKRSDLRYDASRAAVVMNWIEKCLHHTEGDHAGKPFILFAWERFVVGSVFGWKTKDGLRRFRRAYIETGKGSGKSPAAAGMALWLFVMEMRARARAFVIARTLDQGAVVMGFLNEMAIRSRYARGNGFTTAIKDGDPLKITNNRTGATVERVAGHAEGEGHSGPTASLVICDEFHEHDTSNMLDRYTAAFKSVREPLALILTNAGAGMETPCGIEHLDATAVLEGAKENDSYFPFVCGVDAEDQPFDGSEDSWPKGNPSFRHGLPSLAYYREAVRKVKGSGAGQATVERLLFGRWTETVSPWMTREAWDTVIVDELTPEGDRQRARCIGALDLASKWDICAGSLLWDFGDHAELDTSAWCPADLVTARTETDKLPYQDWINGGFMTAVAGKLVSYSWVAAWIKAARTRWGMLALIMDPYHRTLLEERLAEIGVTVTTDIGKIGGPDLVLVSHPQGYRAPRTLEDTNQKARRPGSRKETRLWFPGSINLFEEAIHGQQIRIRRNPVFRFAAAGVRIETDAVGNRMFQRKKSRSKIDALVAATMAVGGRDALFGPFGGRMLGSLPRGPDFTIFETAEFQRHFQD